MLIYVKSKISVANPSLPLKISKLGLIVSVHYVL